MRDPSRYLIRPAASSPNKHHNDDRKRHDHCAEQQNQNTRRQSQYVIYLDAQPLPERRINRLRMMSEYSRKSRHLPAALRTRTSVINRATLWSELNIANRVLLLANRQ